MHVDPTRAGFAPPKLAMRAAMSAYRGALALIERLLPPELLMLDRAFGLVRTSVVGTVARLGIADLIEARGAMSGSEIAAQKKLDADATHRFLRAAAALGVFELLPDGKFINNRASKTLRTRHRGSMRNFADYLGSASNLRAYAALEDYLRDGGINPFERANGKDVWAWFSEHAYEGQTFAGSMQDATTMDAPAIASGFAFGELSTLCDVAGGRGTLLAEVLVRNPTLRGILVDEKYVLDEAGEVLGPRGVEARVDKIAANFFTDAMPAADGYLLKDILHDWDDARCVTILKNVRRGAARGARLFAVEGIVEHSESTFPGPLVDLHMMVVCVGGRQRSRAQLERLFHDGGFVLNEVRPLATATHSLVLGTAL